MYLGVAVLGDSVLNTVKQCCSVQSTCKVMIKTCVGCCACFQEGVNTSENSFALFYGKFRTCAPRVKVCSVLSDCIIEIF